jgi:hypothetical protein
MKTNEEKIMALLRECVVVDEHSVLDVTDDFFTRLQCLTQAQEGREGDGWKALVDKSIAILTDNVVPGGISNSECINRLLQLLDGPEYRAVLAKSAARPIPSPGAEGDTKRLEAVRFAWEAGFKLCQSYGDNWIHFGGQQKERQWKWFLESAGYAHFYPTDASRLPRTQEVQS